MKLRVGKTAERQADQIEDWWVANRTAAPSLFTDELEEVFRRICEIRGAGVRWPTSKRPTLRRILKTTPQRKSWQSHGSAISDTTLFISLRK